ncbi:MAG: helix-turn-helix transcriptional regulator [Prevotella sp.]|nr:helix-turn-helix transcriptional regulator [Prevotella sp.]
MMEQEMHQADSLYSVNDMANSLKHLLVVYEHAQKEDNHKFKLEAIHLLCQIEESLGFTELLSNSARILIQEAERSGGIDDVNYYLSFAHMHLAYCRILDKDLNGCMIQLDSANHEISHSKELVNICDLKMNLMEYRAYAYYYNEHFEQAYSCYRMMLSECEEMKQKKGYGLSEIDAKSYLLIAYSFLPEVCLHLDKKKEAEEYVNKALSIYHDSLGMMDVIPSIADYLSETGQYERMRQMLEPFIQTSSTPSDVMKGLGFLIEAYDKLGMSNMVYPLHKRYVDLRDSLQESDMKSAIQQMSVLNSLFERQIAELRAAKERARWAWGFAVCLLVGLLGWVTWFLWRKYEHERLKVAGWVKKHNVEVFEHPYQAIDENPPVVSPPKEEASSEDESVAKENDHEDNILFIKEVESYVKENDRFRDMNFDMTPLARQLNMTASELETKFADITGCSITTVVNRLRLSYASKLLETTNKKLEVVAEESGFGSSRTFYRQFKSEYDMTPNVYRNLVKVNAQEKDSENA